MKYELDILESIIKDTIDSPGKIRKQSDDYIQSVNADIERLQKTFIREVFSLKNEKFVQLYIQNHQSALISLSDNIFKNLVHSESKNTHPKTDDFSVSDLQKLICRKIDNLLLFIRTRFPNFFNHDHEIPKHFQLEVQKELIENNQELYYRVESENNCTLLDISFYPLKKIQESNASVSFNTLIYINKLCHKINDSCLTCSANSSNCTLKTSLIYLNFNSYRFFTYLTQEIKQEYAKKDTLHGQIEELSYQLKQINQMQVKPDFIYKPEHKPLNEQLANWLMEEIGYLEKKMVLSSEITKDNKVQIDKDFKIVTENSVSQVAFFVKILVEAGAITNKNQRELIQFLAAKVKTKQTNQISPESLRTKYYYTDEGTKNVVKDTIIKLLNIIQNKN